MGFLMQKVKAGTWLPGLLLPAVIATSLSLGFWQLQRAAEKRALLQSFDAVAAMPAASLAELNPLLPQRGRLVRLQGSFRREAVLLDNRILKGRAGVEVHQAFFDRASGREVLINRGWMPLAADRRLPRITYPEGEVQLTARVHVPHGRMLVLQKDSFGGRWPWLVQSVSVQAVSRALERPLFAQVLRLSAVAPGALPRHWPVVNMRPVVHTGYAVQWFGVAAICCTLSLAWLYRRLAGHKMQSKLKS